MCLSKLWQNCQNQEGLYLKVSSNLYWAPLRYLLFHKLVFKDFYLNLYSFKITDQEQKSHSKAPLLNEYSFPAPLPEDKFDSFGIKSDEAYLFISSKGTGTSYVHVDLHFDIYQLPTFVDIGTVMHLDPNYTDAFNGLIIGEKWWVSMPNDLYEYSDELTCNPACSDFSNGTNYHRNIAMWYHHILPQLR